jgi:hypothetical protein
MKKVLSILLILVGLVWLSSCASDREIVKKDGQGNVLVSQDYLNSIKGSDPNKDYYYSTDSTWMSEGRLNDKVGILEPGSDNYDVAYEMEDSSFHIFQVELDEANKIVSIPWLAGITEEPQLEFLKKDYHSGPLANKKEAIAGLGAYNPVKFIIKYTPMRSRNDNYDDVNDRNSVNSRGIVSWDKDAFLGVKYVKQAKKQSGEATLKMSVKEGETIEFKETKSRAQETGSILVEAGGGKATVDVSNGEYIQLCNEKGDGIKSNPLKPDALELIGLKLVHFAMLDEDWLQIDTVAETINTDLNKSEEIDNDWESFDQSRLGPMRYAKMKNYVQSGYIRVKTEDLVKDDGKFISRSHKELALWCIDNKVIGINPKTGKQMGSFLIEPSILKEVAPDLYQKYKGSIHFPKLK